MNLLMDILGQSRKQAIKANAAALYRRVVKQARSPGFHEVLEVPDTIDGRFDLVVLHCFLVLRRLKEDARQTEALSQALFDAMFLNLDDSLRQMGVGDLSVGKRIKKMSSAFYGRVNAYDEPLVSGDILGLSEALSRNLFRAEPIDERVVEAVARYVLQTWNHLQTQPAKHFCLGLVDFEPLDVDLSDQEVRSARA